MVSGVGFLVHVPAGAEMHIAIGQEILLYTVLIAREDSLTLYGFLDPRQREIFSLLIGVSGVGPKTAINILGSIDPNRFLDEVVNENINYLSSLPGIGKKSAQRIVLELKEKIIKHFQRQGQRGQNIEEDAVEALIALGYSDSQARKAVSGTKADSLEGLIKQALKEMR
jgi:holliday junction DNA helicase RuvA